MFWEGLITLGVGGLLVWYGLPNFIKRLILKFLKINNDDSSFSGEEKSKRSRHISQSVKDKVWNRDGGKCVECGSNQNLEFDHIIPHSKGGANTYRNIQLLCEPCNRTKSAKIG